MFRTILPSQIEILSRRFLYTMYIKKNYSILYENYLRTVTAFGSAMSTKWPRTWTRCLRLVDLVATSLSWSWSTRNTSSASAATEAICLSALLRAQLVTASNSRSRTVGAPCSSCSLTRLRWTGAMTRWTNGMASR